MPLKNICKRAELLRYKERLPLFITIIRADIAGNLTFIDFPGIIIKL